MINLILLVALLASIFPVLTSAQCPSCDSYSAALQSCGASSLTVGTTLSSSTLHCMCSSKSNLTEMNACLGCQESDPTTIDDITLLSAWTTTCTADGQFGEKQAALCWQSQPSNFLPCQSNTGGGSAGNSGGDGSATSSQSPTSNPTAASKSDAMVSFHSSVLLVVVAIGCSLVL